MPPTVPPTVAAAAHTYRTRHHTWHATLPAPLGTDPTLQPGDIRTGHAPDGLHRHTLLLRPITLHGHDAWQVRLTHPYPEMATDTDRIHPPWQATPHPLVTTPLRFVLLTHQIGTERHGWLAPHATGIPGPPLTRPLDARWAFRQHETRDATRLQQPAVRCALDWCDCPATP